MKAINSGNRYDLYDNSIKTYDQLPARTYEVCFSPKMGFWLEGAETPEVSEKIYGSHLQKVDKVFKSFNYFTRNMGVILSGRKGIGKSLFAKILSNKAIDAGYPLIIVNTYYPGIADFIDSIEQEVVVLFDEFEKTFSKMKENDGVAADPQTEMLTLFDGLSSGKKLFIVTCNELRQLNDFLINRPGRFHYHFRFENPSPDEIKEYVKDHVTIDAYNENINDILNFAGKVALNFDCLRAICFELTLGEKFKDAIKDLNIVNINATKYTVYLYLSNGEMFKQKRELDLFSNEVFDIAFGPGYSSNEYSYPLIAKFTPSNAIWNYEMGGNVIDSKKIELSLDPDLTDKDAAEYEKKAYNKYKDVQPISIVIKRDSDASIHYAV